MRERYRRRKASFAASFWSARGSFARRTRRQQTGARGAVDGVIRDGGGIRRGHWLRGTQPQRTTALAILEFDTGGWHGISFVRKKKKPCTRSAGRLRVQGSLVLRRPGCYSVVSTQYSVLSEGASLDQALVVLAAEVSLLITGFEHAAVLHH